MVRGIKVSRYDVDHFIVVLCTNGQATRRINQHRFQIAPNSVHIISPGQILSFSNTRSDFNINVLLFERNFLAQFNLIGPR